jgi:uroporphyrinogen-III decarboxylase
MVAVYGRIWLLGNVNNPETLFARGPEEVRAEVMSNLEAGVQMVGPECACPLQTPLENLRAIPEAIQEWRANRENE